MMHRLPNTNRKWPRQLGMGIGLLLLLGAVVVMINQRQVVLDALAAVFPPAPWPLAILLCSVALNIVLSGIMFSLLMSRYGTVGRLEMQALIAATTLVNYLPLRPGLLGRVAYHNRVNNIRMMDSARAIVHGVAISIAVASYVALAVLLTMTLNAPLWLSIAAPVAPLGLLGLARSMRIWCWAGLIRYCEVLVWAVRYFAAFALLGMDISWQSSLAFACVSVIATMVPFVSNGLGLREWSIGLVAPLLTTYQLSLGLTAELVNRAAELVGVSIMGITAMAYLARRQRAAAAKA